MTERAPLLGGGRRLDQKHPEILPYTASRIRGGALASKPRSYLLSAPVRRVLLVLTALAACLFYYWKFVLQPQCSEEQEYIDGFRTAPDDTFGTVKKVRFHGTRLLDLDPGLLPGGIADPDGARRLVFVGDIHGCADELRKLLRKVDFDPITDHLIAVGDVISKGPDSAGVVDMLMRNNATSVRGNHEDQILALAPSVLNATAAASEDDSETSSADSGLLRSLSPEHLRYLYDMPLMLRIPPLPLAGKTSAKTSSPIGEEILVVHAGLVPAVALDKQNPFFVMNMRAIHTKTHRPFVEAESKKAKTKAWHDIWCWYNERLFKHKSLKDFRQVEDATIGNRPAPSLFSLEWFMEKILLRSSQKHPQPQVVVYGHRSKEGLQLKRWTKGLDTGCVTGGKLTAFILSADGTHDIAQVKCGNYRS